jgi:hypothetical protein
MAGYLESSDLTSADLRAAESVSELDVRWAERKGVLMVQMLALQSVYWEQKLAEDSAVSLDKCWVAQ